MGDNRLTERDERKKKGKEREGMRGNRKERKINAQEKRGKR